MQVTQILNASERHTIGSTDGQPANQPLINS